MNQSEVLELKEFVENAKTEINKGEGRIANLLESLQNDFGCKNVKEAKKKLDALKKKKEEIQEKINVNIKILEEEYDFEDED